MSNHSKLLVLFSSLVLLIAPACSGGGSDSPGSSDSGEDSSTWGEMSWGEGTWG